MNDQHAQLCSSAEWAEHLATTLVPWALGDDEDLGDDVLEIGPGYGLVTDLLLARVARLTAVEIDPALAGSLAARLAPGGVDVIVGDASDLPFDDARFSAAASFTMLHHVPTVDLQDRIFVELARVLRPGGRLFGTDSLDSPEFRTFHDGDICVPVDPLTLGARLERAGFHDIDIQVWSVGTRFRARA